MTNQSWLAGAVPVGAIIQATDEHIGKQHVHQVVPDIRWWFGFLKKQTPHILAYKLDEVQFYLYIHDALNIACTIYI